MAEVARPCESLWISLVIWALRASGAESVNVMIVLKRGNKDGKVWKTCMKRVASLS